MLIHVGSGLTFLEVQKLQAKKIVLLSSQKIFMVDIFSSHRQKKTKSEKNRQTDRQKTKRRKKQDCGGMPKRVIRDEGNLRRTGRSAH